MSADRLRAFALLLIVSGPLQAGVEECTQRFQTETIAPSTVCFDRGRGLELVSGASVISFPDLQIDTGPGGFSFVARAVQIEAKAGEHATGGKGFVVHPERFRIISEEAFLDPAGETPDDVVIEGTFDGGYYTIPPVVLERAVLLQTQSPNDQLIVVEQFATGQGFFAIRFEVDESLLSDYGDAPPPYPTRSADGGAFHAFSPTASIEGLSNPDTDGTAAAEAQFDFGDNGIVFSKPLLPGVRDTYARVCTFEEPVCVDRSSDLEALLDDGLPAALLNPGFLNVWIDLDRNGAWEDDEQVVVNLAFNPLGLPVELTFTVPPDAVPGISYARARFSTERMSPPSPTGGAPGFGEVEDHIVYIGNGRIDRGDHPIELGSAMHAVVPGFQLGADVAGAAPEAALNTPEAFDFSDQSDGDDNDGRDDEDGLVAGSDLVLVTGPGSRNQVNGMLITTPGGQTAVISAWLDIDGNLEFGMDELILDEVPAQPGSNFYLVAIPDRVSTSQGDVLALPGRASLRLRLHPANVASPAFDAEDRPVFAGEVEDYMIDLQVRIQCSGFEDPPEDPVPANTAPTTLPIDPDDPVELGDGECRF